MARWSGPSTHGSMRGASCAEWLRKTGVKAAISYHLVSSSGLADPRIGLVTVNVVELMPRGKTAHVYVSVTGSAEEAEQTLTALQAAKGDIRHELALRLQARKAPDLMFHLDRSDVIEKKIEAVRAREKR